MIPKPIEWSAYLAANLAVQQRIDHMFCSHPQIDMSKCEESCKQEAEQRIRQMWRVDMQRWFDAEFERMRHEAECCCHCCNCCEHD